jgi:hypothetical protein
MLVYKLLNQEAKNWWYHSDLRKQGQHDKARELERKSMKGTIETLRNVVKYGGYLSLGRKAWSIEVNRHPTSWSKADSPSYCTTSVQGYYGLNRSTHYEAIFHALKLPIIDSRNIDDKQVWDLIAMPLIAKDSQHDSGYISLKNYVDLALKMFHTNFVAHNINLGEK